MVFSVNLPLVHYAQAAGASDQIAFYYVSEKEVLLPKMLF